MLTEIISLKNEIEAYFGELKSAIDKLDRHEIELFIQILLNAYNSGNQIFVMGNGGSAATASHFVCDLNKGVSFGREKRFKVICLNDNTPTVMSYSNDVNYDDIFVEQLKNFIQENDVVIGISGSGNSENILKAMNYANSKNAITVGLTGYKGGKLKNIAKHSVNADIENMQLSEDIHAMILHLVMKSLYNAVRS